jgi:nicotinamidase-related amidase
MVTPPPFDTARTAVVTMEMQRGICGDLASFPALRDAVTGDVTTNAAALVREARQRKIVVVHCTFSLRHDRVGTRLDLPLMSAARRNPDYLLQRSVSTALLPELQQHPDDIVCDRHHGVSPFTNTPLHSILKEQDINSLIVVGVSLNIGIPGLVIEAVNLGYSVTVARDAVAGFPAEYADSVVTNTLSALADIDSTPGIVGRF